MKTMAIISKNNEYIGETFMPYHLFRMNVRVSVKRSVGEQLVIPKTAVVLRSGKQVVFTLKEGKAMWNYVHTGLENMEEYTVTDGLEEGMEVITTGNVNLAHEAPVRVIKN